MPGERFAHQAFVPAHPGGIQRIAAQPEASGQQGHRLDVEFVVGDNQEQVDTQCFDLGGNLVNLFRIDVYPVSDVALGPFGQALAHQDHRRLTRQGGQGKLAVKLVTHIKQQNMLHSAWHPYPYGFKDNIDPSLSRVIQRLLLPTGIRY
ncbi:hypothetical protein D3C80_1434010 [compost metagenome]